MKRTFAVAYENEVGPNDGGYWEWWAVIEQPEGRVIAKCDSQEDAENIAALPQAQVDRR